MKKLSKDEVGSVYVNNTAENVIEELTRYINLYGAGKVTLSMSQDKYGTTEYVGVFVEREETDDEYQHRLIREDMVEKNQEARDRKQFEELSKKYGDKE